MQTKCDMTYFREYGRLYDYVSHFVDAENYFEYFMYSPNTNYRKLLRKFEPKLEFENDIGFPL